MELSYEDKLKLENTKEHLQVVLNNLRVANGELTFVLGQIQEAKSLYEVLNTNNLELSQTITVKTAAMDDREEMLNRKEASLLAREEVIAQAETDSKEKIEKENAAIAELRKEYDALQLQKKTEEAEFVTSCEANAKHLETLKADIESYENIANEKRREITESENERDRINRESEERSQADERTRREAEAELAAIRTRIAEETAFVQVPRQLLDDEDKRVSAKLRNLKILEERLRSQYKVVYPDRLLPIELQEETE